MYLQNICIYINLYIFFTPKKLLIELSNDKCIIVFFYLLYFCFKDSLHALNSGLKTVSKPSLCIIA